MKAFLSHSSKDKDFVSKVFEYLTASRAHYDSVTFHSFERSHEALTSALRDSDVIVVFWSPDALGSPWVKEEIRSAADPSLVGRHMERLVVLVGGDRASLPPELRQATAISYSDPGLVARRIEDYLVQLHQREAIPPPFLGREDDLKALSSGVIPVGRRPPEFIFVNGIPGVGRKTVITRVIKDNYPFISQALRVVRVVKGVSAADLYFRIRSVMMTGTVSEHMEEVERFAGLSSDLQISEIANILSEAVGERDPLVLEDAAWLLDDRGCLAPWFMSILEKVPAKPYPQVLMVSSRALSPQGRVELSERYYAYSLVSLSRANSTRLLASLLRRDGVELDEGSLAALIEIVDGHPQQIVRAAHVVSQGRATGADLRVRELIDALSQSAESLIRLVELTTAQYLAIRLFNEFEFLSVEDLSQAFSDRSTFEEGLFGLLDLCFVERIGEFLRLAPSIGRPLVRMAEKNVDDDLFVEARRKIASRLSVMEGDDLVRYEVLEASVAAWIGSSKLDPPLKAAKLLLPASLLRCAQRAYDARDWVRASEFAQRALEGDWKLSSGAVLEAYRIRGLTLARLGEDGTFDVIVKQLYSYGANGAERSAAQRTANFLSGFKARLDGDYDAAFDHLSKVVASNKRIGFSVLREFSDVLMKLGRLDEAMQYARQALSMADGNPYVLAMLLDIIDRKIERDGASAAMATERRDLFARLRRADEVERTSFAGIREARELARDGRYDEALGVLDRGNADRDYDPIVFGLERARILHKQRRYEPAFAEAEACRKRAVSTLGKRAVEFFDDIDEIKIRCRVEQGRIPEARELLVQAKRIRQARRDELEKLIAFASDR